MSQQRSETITVNSDMGEAFGIHSFGNDEALMPYLDVANVACGFHSGDPTAMETTVALARQHDVKVGAHPGLPDLVGFGRREMKLYPEEVESIIRYQVGALKGFLDKYDMPLNHIKPHGSLYGMLARDEELMTAAAQVAKTFGVPMFGIAGSAHERVCEREGVEFVGELYVDLNYDANGVMIIVRRPEHTSPEAASARVTRVLEDGLVEAVDGTLVSIPFDSVCVHSDTPNAVEVARAVREALNA